MTEPEVAPIPGLVGNRWVMTPDQLAELPQLPKHLVVIGSGPESIAVARKYAGQGVPVTLLEGEPGLAAASDPSESMTLSSDLTKQGVKVRTGAKIIELGDLGEAASVEFREGLNSVARIFADVVVVPDAVLSAANASDGNDSGSDRA